MKTKTVTLIIRENEAKEIVDLLKRLAKVYAILGFYEDKDAIFAMTEMLEKRLGKK